MAAPPLVMLVESPQESTNIMKSLLEISDYRVLKETSIDEAVENFIDFTRRERPDLILLNMSQSSADDLAAVRLICANAKLRNIPVIAVGGTGDISATDALDAGCNKVLDQPISAIRLNNIIFGTLNGGN
jgi:CheY-like chemotaxis protein